VAKFRVVITDFEYDSLLIEQEIMDRADADFVTAQCRTEDEVIAAVQGADGILNQYAPITEKVIENLHNCKVISRYGVGVNTIDLDSATRKGIIVANCTDYCLDEVSDHAMALLLDSARKISFLNGRTKAGTWDYKQAIPVYRLRGRVLGLIGFGRISQNFSMKANAFGLKVVVYDPYITDELAFSYRVERVDLTSLCMESDFISVHLPLTQATKGMIGKKQFSCMKPEAVILNTSRGSVIDETALIEALQSSIIAGAALDVTEEEPLDMNHPFLTMEQVILTPHTAWYSEESERELKRKVAQNVADVLSGFYPSYLANSAVKGFLDLKEKS
jgi:D-3-phosphoglycerate dehydrogenase